MHWLTILLKNREFDLRSSVSQKAKEYLINSKVNEYPNFDPNKPLDCENENGKSIVQ